MNLREVELYDAHARSRLKWIFKGSFQEAETDLRKFVAIIGITNWYGTISAMQGLQVIRP